MKTNARWSERIGAVFLPEPDVMELVGDADVGEAGPQPFPSPQPFPQPFPSPQAFPQPFPFPPFTFCSTTLKQGCYTLHVTPAGATLLSTRYRGTLRVELTPNGPRMSGDLYRYRLLDDIVIGPPGPVLPTRDLVERIGTASDEAADTGGVIPIYSRGRYNSYLKGTKAQLVTVVPKGSPCRFTLEFDQFFYTHPGSGFSGSFPSTPNRSVRFVLHTTPTPDLYSGEVYEGATQIGTGSIRWISPHYRRADLRVNTLTGSATPPSVGGSDFHTIFADVGWDVTVTDGGTVPLPPALSGVTTTACWSDADLHTLMQSVPGYSPADLDTAWRVHLVAVPAALGCSRGVMFDSSLGADPNDVAREGTATFSDDGYPSGEVPDGMGGSHYDGAADQQQRNTPRAFLRSATHEVGHAFNQIHQGFEGGNDNSIMTPTPGVASVLGTGGTFPDQINLAFNERVKKHLRHYPDPAVRPGAMDFFGAAVGAPEPADVSWVDALDVEVTPSSDRVQLGEPITLTWTLTNTSQSPVPVPNRVDVEALIARVSVTDPTGRVTFMRPANVQACFQYEVTSLEPGGTLTGSTTLFWGRDGFAFETSGRHLVEVIALWAVGGLQLAATSETEVFVSFPASDADNEVAALMLSPEVGRAVAAGDITRFERAAERVRAAAAAAGDHPAVAYLRQAGLAPEGGP